VNPVDWLAAGSGREVIGVVPEPTNFDGLRGLRAGSRFGHYRLRRLLGEGGFGQVWEADDTVMDRVAAVKLLKPTYSENENFRQRLYREARAAGQLHAEPPLHSPGPPKLSASPATPPPATGTSPRQPPAQEQTLYAHVSSGDLKRRIDDLLAAGIMNLQRVCGPDAAATVAAIEAGH
jgi:serine/threonine protein kinase